VTGATTRFRTAWLGTKGGPLTAVCGRQMTRRIIGLLSCVLMLMRGRNSIPLPQRFRFSDRSRPCAAGYWGEYSPPIKRGPSRLPRNRFCRRIASTTRRWLIRMKALHRELQLFGCPDFLACFDLDRLTGCRIAPHTSCALPDLQDAKTSNPNSLRSYHRHLLISSCSEQVIYMGPLSEPRD
jgi:hypothetical protein